MLDIIDYRVNTIYMDTLMKIGTLPKLTQSLICSKFEHIPSLQTCVLVNIIRKPSLFDAVAANSSLLCYAHEQFDKESYQNYLFCPDLDIVACNTDLDVLRDLVKGEYHLVTISVDKKNLSLLLDETQYGFFYESAKDNKVLKLRKITWCVVPKPRYFVHMIDGFSYHQVDNFIKSYFDQKYEDFYNLYSGCENDKKATEAFVAWLGEENINTKAYTFKDICDRYYKYAMHYHMNNDNVIFLSTQSMWDIVYK